MNTDQERGLYQKYRVERLNDPTGKHNDCPFFVLDLRHDSHARVALRAYAESCRAEYPFLAADIEAQIAEERTIVRPVPSVTLTIPDDAVQPLATIEAAPMEENNDPDSGQHRSQAE